MQGAPFPKDMLETSGGSAGAGSAGTDSGSNEHRSFSSFSPSPSPSLSSLVSKNGNKYLQVAATCKHLVAYSFEVGNVNGEHVSRHKFQANVTAQELAETYLPAFQACVQGGRPQQIMCSYNSLAVAGAYNSTPMCLNKNNTPNTTTKQH